MADIKIEYIKIDKIKPYKFNPRKNENAVSKVKESINDFGFLVPVILEKDNTILAGHTRYEAAKDLQLDSIPCIYASGLTDEQCRQFRIIDNKTTELSSWDYSKLFIEAMQIPEIDLAAFGFGSFLGTDDGETKEQKIESGSEIILNDFGTELNLECPFCGYRWAE